MLVVALAAMFSLSGCVTALVGATAAGTGLVIGSDSRTLDKMVHDERIEQEALEIVQSYKTTNTERMKFSIDVVSMCGNVLMVGQTQEQAALQEMIGKIRKIKNVRKIYNYVKNKAPISAGAVAQDSYITSKVKSALLLGNDIHSGRIKVYTEDRDVFLLGYVTRDEARRALNQTQKVEGINNIYHIFDYMQDIPAAGSSVPVVNGTSGASSSSGYQNSSSSLQEQVSGSVDNGGATIVGNDDLLAPATPNTL
ncbi:MAG: BON domain-containing protein [Succinivibrio sp.]|nr:BON domain-containing protein [Succinivibrio sp.]